jgi:hypothetical protein
MRMAGNHVEAGLLRAIVAEAAADCEDRVKPVVIIEEVCSTDWASATFVGQTVEIKLRCEGAPQSVAAFACRMMENLPEREFTIAGQIVADLAVVEGNMRMMHDGIISKSLTVNVLLVRD